MTEPRRLQVSPTVAATVLLSVLVVGAGGTYLLMRDSRGDAHESLPGSAPGGIGPATHPAEHLASSPAPDISPATSSNVVVTLTKDAIDRAGIIVTQVSTRSARESLRVPGVVEPNAYRQVSVTPLVTGRVIQVNAQLGDRVRAGQSIAAVYSPELAEARTKYVAAKAMLEAHDRELQRTQNLTEIGAASRQELERIHAEHAAQTAEVESARSRLQLLGADAEDGASSKTESATTIPAPIDGVITERLANVGLNVDPASQLFTIVDLSNVWIVANVYERDLHRVREGAAATVTTRAYPDRALKGRVGYIDPQLDVTTRTAKVRIEVANPRGDWRLGMYTDVAIESASATPVVAVARDAIQNVGDKQVVYVTLSTDPAKFVEREVHLGRAWGDQVEVIAGLSGGDAVVSKGSFFVRAEAERLGFRSSQPSSSPSGAANIVNTPSPAMATPTSTGRAEITFKSQPDTPQMGENVFEVMVMLAGKPVDDAIVSVELFMPAMPQMKMAEMRTTVDLKPIGKGMYRGTGQVMVAGNWAVTVTAMRQGQEIGTRKLTLTAK